MADITITSCELKRAVYKLPTHTLPVYILYCDFSDAPQAGDRFEIQTGLVSDAYMTINDDYIFAGFYGGYNADVFNIPQTTFTDPATGIMFTIATDGVSNSWVSYNTSARLNGYYVACGGGVYTGYSNSEYSPLIFIVDNATKKILQSNAPTSGGAPIPYTMLSDNDYNIIIGADNIVLVSPEAARLYTPLGNQYFTIQDIIELENLIPASAEDDPYSPGGISGSGGGGGSFDLTNDSIDFPSLPTLSAVDTGLVSIYKPSLAQLRSLATFLWNANPTDVEWWKKLVANPLDLILGLSIVPVEVPSGSAQTIKVGLIDTGVSVTKAASQFVTVDCGSLYIKECCGNTALDFSPFTKFSLYLPFIGTRTISCDDIMKRTVHVKYNVDLLSGACTAMVKITGGPQDNPLDAILYQYSGACAISVPLTGETFTNMITSTIQLAASIGATVATGGAAAGVTAASAANSLMSMKPIIERAGGVSGAAGQLGVMTPYLIAEVPRQSVPENANQFTGYPSNMKAKLGDLSGFTTVDIIHMENIPATNAEKEELESILKAGVIL